MSRTTFVPIAALAATLGLPGGPAAAGPWGCAGYGYRCVQTGSRFNIESSRERFSRHGAAWRHDDFGYSGYYGGPGIRRNYALGWGVRSPSCYFTGAAAPGFQADAATPIDAPRRAVTPVERRGRAAGPAAAPGRGATPWDLLGDGRFAEARRGFAVLALRDTTDASAMAGFALASAFRGEFDAAATALRSAVETGAESLRGLPEVRAERSGLLPQRIRAAAEAATNRAGRGSWQGDPMFLVAALAWILDDEPTARAAILAAVFRGDEEPSTRILYEALTRPRSGDQAPNTPEGDQDAPRGP